MIKIFPYKMGSKSGKELAHGLGAKRVYPNRRYRYRQGHTIINWGNTQLPDWYTEQAGENMLNKPSSVQKACDKLLCLNTLRDSGVPCLEFTEDIMEAIDWDIVYVRNTLNGHSGQGIEVIDTSVNMLPDAPLYTRAVNSCGEYRIHVFGDKVIDFRKKSRRNEDHASEEQSRVRTHDNGWIFRMGGIEITERQKDVALRAIKALGLDFGAVDMLKDDDGNDIVIEVNTAVGLTGSTITNYVNAINEYYG